MADCKCTCQCAGREVPRLSAVPSVSSRLTAGDRWGELRVRLGIGRMRYHVEPGLYALGSPGPESPVLVSANFKLSFDCLRSSVSGLDAWILVLDTGGINVWCAAGKGTFGTEELVKRIQAVSLESVVTHRRLVVPQLGAPGVSAHEVKRRSGFRVCYGPVRAEDLPEFLAAGMKATPAMRRVRFPFPDRIALTPMELVSSAKYAIPVAAVFALLGGLSRNGFALADVATIGFSSALVFLLAYVVGAVGPAALLPWLPGRTFSAKGAWLGALLALILIGSAPRTIGLSHRWMNGVAWLLLIPAVTSFLSMNFTGASTYTSLSGVRREMRLAVPLQIAGAAAGFTIWTAALFR